MEKEKKSAENAQEKGIVDEIFEEIRKKNEKHEKRMELIETILNK